MSKHGEFNWNELQTRDAERAVRFYAAVVGWSFESEQMPTGGTYWIGFAAEKPVCGILTIEDDRDDRWFTYVHIDDLDACLEKVEDLGGTVLKPAWHVPGVGSIAVVRDPGGAEVGWVTPL